MNVVKIERSFSSDSLDYKTNHKKSKKYESLFINTKEINSSLDKEYNALNFINPKLKNESRVFDLINLLGNKKEFLKLKSTYENENRKINKDIMTHKQVEQNLLNFNTVNINSFDKKKLNSDNPIQLSTEDNFIMKMIKYNAKKHQKKNNKNFNKNFFYFKSSLSQDDMIRKYNIRNSKKYQNNIRNNIFEKLYRNKYRLEKYKNKKLKLEVTDPVKIIDNLIKNYEKKQILNNPNNHNNNQNKSINKNKNKNENKEKNIKNQRKYNSLINLNSENKSLFKSNSIKSINSTNSNNIASIKKKSSFSPEYHDKTIKNSKSSSCDEFHNIQQPKNDINFDFSNINSFETIFKEENKIKNDSEEINNNLLDIKFEKYFNKIKIYQSVIKNKFFKIKKKPVMPKIKKGKSHFVNIKENLSQYKKGLYDYAIVNKYIYGSRSPIAVFRGNRNIPFNFNLKKIFF